MFGKKKTSNQVIIWNRNYYNDEHHHGYYNKKRKKNTHICTLNMAFNVTMVNFPDDIAYKISEQILSWMMDEFIHWSKPYMLLSTTCDEILSWMIEIWMKIHLVSDSNHRHCKSVIPPKIYKD